MNKKIHKFLIYTKRPGNYFSLEYIKYMARVILKKSRGPQAVNDSLIRGLKELKFDYKLNSRHTFIGDETVYVNASIDALRWAIKLKKDKKIKKLIAGPNITISPLDKDYLICSEEIDLFLVPSHWVRDWFLSLAPSLTNKLEIWPSGSKDYGVLNNKNINKKILLYFKFAPEKLLNEIRDFLKSKKCDYEILKYGHFKRMDYLNLLDKSQLMVYFQESESQGISLVEAWSKNVPTFVWSGGCFKKDDYIWHDPKISAPFLNDESGNFFKDLNLFISIFDRYLKGDLHFEPRRYYLNNFTDSICAKNFLRIIDKHDYY